MIARQTYTTDYYPFGMVMSNRTWQATSLDKYRFGFNGKEMDDEVNVEGGSYDFGERIYDGRLGRFLSIDILTKGYPELSPYQFASNTPIWAIDLDGTEAYFNTEGKFLKYGTDASSTAPVILMCSAAEINIGLTVEQFQNRVYWITGEGARNQSQISVYYAHTIKNAKEYGYHGKGFTESKLYDVLWQSENFSSKDFLAGLPTVNIPDNPYKLAFPKKNNFSLWDETMIYNGKQILLAEANLSNDPTRGATNWGGGLPNYNKFSKDFGANNVVSLEEGGAKHNFYNLNTGKLDPVTTTTTSASGQCPVVEKKEPKYIKFDGGVDLNNTDKTRVEKSPY